MLSNALVHLFFLISLYFISTFNCERSRTPASLTPPSHLMASCETSVRNAKKRRNKQNTHVSGLRLSTSSSLNHCLFFFCVKNFNSTLASRDWTGRCEMPRADFRKGGFLRFVQVFESRVHSCWNDKMIFSRGGPRFFQSFGISVFQLSLF